MSTPGVLQDDDDRRRSTRRLFGMAALVLVAVLLAANAHLVYVAFSSQPDCVAHLEDAGGPGSYRAAKSAC